MATEDQGSPRRHGRTRGALAGVFVVVAAAGMFAFPASALAAPTAGASIVAVAAPVAASSGAKSPGQRGAGSGSGSGEPGDINVAMLAMVASLGLAIGAPLAGRARIARWRCVRRFRVQLLNVDTVGVCFEETNRR